MSTKLMVVLVAIMVIAFGGYYITSGGGASSNVAQVQPTTNEQPIAAPQAPAASDLPQASGTVDDFTAAIDADLQASVAAVGALDADIDASVTNVQSTGASSNLYDPSNI